MIYFNREYVKQSNVPVVSTLLLREFAPSVREIVTPAQVMVPDASPAIPLNICSMANVLINVHQCFMWI